ncbi:hypothetical protein K4F52_008374 [Lecanicillium sp. MT-2017a]|nr:hypothetical protein K4F52_008374 [Lecanicillium sp. MT-2017a]
MTVDLSLSTAAWKPTSSRSKQSAKRHDSTDSSKSSSDSSSSFCPSKENFSQEDSLLLSQPGAENTVILQLADPSTRISNQVWAVLPLAEAGTQNVSYELQSQYLNLYGRFISRTLNTLSSKALRNFYSTRFIPIVQSNPALLHMCFALTILHDAHVSASPLSGWLQSALSFHWYHGAALFLKQLSSATASDKAAAVNPVSRTPFADDEALWMASALLSVSALANVDPRGPSAAWPLRKPGPLDLDWLKLVYGKRAVLEVVDVPQPGSILEIVQKENWWQKDSDAFRILPGTLPDAFINLYDLPADPCLADPFVLPYRPPNPYYNAVAVLSQMMPIDTSQPSLFHGRFIAAIGPPLRCLLEAHDTRAMLLLLYWYAKVAPMPVWWTRNRAVAEGLAVWEFLRRRCLCDDVVMQLLEWPMQELRKVANEDGRLKACAVFVERAIGASDGCVVC